MTSLVMRAIELPGGRGIHLFERNVMSHRRTWPIIVSGFFEPLFYLLSLGYGLGGYVGDVVIDGQTIEYAAFVAPALLAASAFNGAFYDAPTSSGSCATRRSTTRCSRRRSAPRTSRPGRPPSRSSGASSMPSASSP